MLYRPLTRTYAYRWPRPARRRSAHQREFDRLWHEMDRLFTNTPRWNAGRRRNVARTYPATNVWTNEEGAVVRAELPGVAPEDIDLAVVHDTLTLSGARTPDEPEGATYLRRERGHGDFTRTFQLPFPVQEDQVEASFDNGVLHITLPRAKEDRPKRIEVKAG